MLIFETRVVVLPKILLSFVHPNVMSLIYYIPDQCKTLGICLNENSVPITYAKEHKTHNRHRVSLKYSTPVHFISVIRIYDQIVFELELNGY